MKLTHIIRASAVIIAGAFCVSSALADTVETKNGSRLVGSVTKIDSGTVYLKTDYAGDLEIKQSDVASITTDTPINVRLESGTVLEGTVSSQAGALTISGSDGQLTTTVDKVAATWAPGGEDPQVAALRRHWEYEAGVDITGKTGNSEQLGTQVSARATLKTPQDTLQFYTAYNRQVSDGTKSADQFKAGVDYQNNFSGKKSWYVRDEGGFDRVKDIDLYNVAAFGLGYDVIKEPKHVLTLRTGISYRYEGYGNPTTEDVSSAGLDLGLNHEWELESSRIVNRIAFVPTFEDLGVFRLTHESFYEVPLASPVWKLRLGISHDFNSEPGIGVDKLDTSYFTRLVLSWK
jgi:putative salt-induced outer membrane protein YdiY